MYQEFFAKSPLLGLPLFALCVFITVFAGIVVRVLRRKPREFDALAELALKDEESNTP